MFLSYVTVRINKLYSLNNTYVCNLSGITQRMPLNVRVLWGKGLNKTARWRSLDGDFFVQPRRTN